MTPAEFKRARETLCLSQNDLAEVWDMGDNGGRTIRRWECGERPLNPIAAYCMRPAAFWRCILSDCPVFDSVRRLTPGRS